MLLKDQGPAWAIALLSLGGMVVMAWYQHVLNRRLKTLEHKLQTNAMAYEKSYELVRDRHVKRVDALDRLNGLIMHFNHDVRHVQNGDLTYKDMLDDNYAKVRAFARDTESLLGREMYETIVECTDHGRSVLNASYCVTDRTLRLLETRDLAPHELAALSTLLGKRFPIIGTDDLALENIPAHTLHTLFKFSSVSEEFDDDAYSAAMAKFEQQKADILRTLPVIPEV